MMHPLPAGLHPSTLSGNGIVYLNQPFSRLMTCNAAR
jgi:hypothetical protein